MEVNDGCEVSCLESSLEIQLLKGKPLMKFFFSTTEGTELQFRFYFLMEHILVVKTSDYFVTLKCDN